MNQPLAYVHPGAKIAKNVVIEPFTTINNDVVIGEGTWIGSNVTIMEGARIGKNCSIFPGSVISAPPQDLKYNGEETQTIIGDNTTIRECVTINRGTMERQKTAIGNNCLIMAYCHIAHDCIVGDHCIFSNNSTLAGHVNIGNYVILAGMTAIHQFCTIGDYAFITGGSLVRKDVPPYVKAAREPLSYVGLTPLV
jgi:UDP-N-acetylglucosamine acyltransferase